MKFARDDYKAAANFRKHGVSLEEAEIIIGHSEEGRLLFVCFVERAGSAKNIKQ